MAALRPDSVETSSTPPPVGSPPSAGEATGTQAIGVLHEVLLALAHESPREVVLKLVASKARLLTGSESAAVALLDDEGEYVTFAAASGENEKEVRGTRVRVADTIVGNTARTGEVLLSFNPAAPGGADRGGIASSAAVVPIHADGHPVGALAAMNKIGDKPFAGDDLLALTTLAAAASVGLVNYRLRADSDRQGRELSTLYEAVRNVSGQLSAQEVLAAAIEQVVFHIPNSAVAIFLVNDERTHFYISADHGLQGDQREVTLATESGMGAAALVAGRPMFLTFAPDTDDYFDPGAPPPLESPFPGLPARSGLAAPIRTGDVTHGLILAISNEPDVYKIADANLLSALAAQAGVAIENAWLYEDATRRAEEATTLYELSQTITSTLRLPDVLELVADSVLTLLSVDKFALFLHERATDRLQMVVARGLPEGVEERVQPIVGQGIPGWVMEFETPTAVQDVAADHRNHAAPLHTEGVVSMMCMPLQVGATAIGVLCAASARRRLFTVAEMELLYTVANQAAIAIENARNYADVQQKSRELRKYFHRVARALGSSQSPGDVPQLIAGLTVEVMGADRCVLYSVAEDDPALQIESCINFRTLTGDTGDLLPLSEDTPAGWIARKARPLAIDDLSRDTRFTEGLARMTRSRIASYLGVPLRVGRSVIGVLEVYTRAPRHWRSDEVRLLLTFASQATVAFQNGRLAAESGRASRDARLLKRLMKVFSEDSDPRRVAEAIGQELQAAAAVLLRQPGGEWTIGAGYDLNDEARATLQRHTASPSASTETAEIVFVPAANIALAVVPPAADFHPPIDVLSAAVRLLSHNRDAQPHAGAERV